MSSEVRHLNEKALRGLEIPHCVRNDIALHCPLTSTTLSILVYDDYVRIAETRDVGGYHELLAL